MENPGSAETTPILNGSEKEERHSDFSQTGTFSSLPIFRKVALAMSILGGIFLKTCFRYVFLAFSIQGTGLLGWAFPSCLPSTRRRRSPREQARHNMDSCLASHTLQPCVPVSEEKRVVKICLPSVHFTWKLLILFKHIFLKNKVCIEIFFSTFLDSLDGVFRAQEGSGGKHGSQEPCWRSPLWTPPFRLLCGYVCRS